MVARNPLLAGKWSAKQLSTKFQATVINDIWPEVTFFSLVAAMVALVSEKTSHSLAVSSTMLTVLGTVLGLVVSFRTSSAYDRYSEGRKLWSSVSLATRALAHMIWIHVPIDRVDKTKARDVQDGEKPPKSAQLKAIIEKKSMINLIQAFPVAVKHMLRGEPGIYYEDLYPLVCFLPRYASHPPALQADSELLPLWEASLARDVPPVSPGDQGEARTDGMLLRTVSPAPQEDNEKVKEEEGSEIGNSESHSGSRSGSNSRMGSGARTLSYGGRSSKRKSTFNPESVLPAVVADRPLAPARNPPKATIYDYLPIFLIFKPIVSLVKKLASKPRTNDGRTALGRKRKPDVVSSNVPLEITLFLSSYLAWLLKAGLLQPAIATGLTNNIAALQDTMANLDRVANTPIPFAYQAHLRMSMWLYLFFLPFQLYSTFKYLTIPATAFASFLLLGFLEIGQEIENPFNYDLNDLDLDHFCLIIERELHEITAHPAPDPETYLFGQWNQPFAPADRRSAEEMLRDVSHEYHGAETGMHSIRRTLLKSWKEVHETTLDHHRVNL